MIATITVDQNTRKKLSQLSKEMKQSRSNIEQHELWSSKVFLIEEQGCPEKLAAQVGKDLDLEHVQELMALSREEMESRLANSLLEVERAKKEVAENEKYKQAKQDVKYFEDALKEKVNPLKAVAQLMLWKLEDSSDESDWKYE